MILPFQHRGVLGLNARNLLYIKPFNPRKAVAFADDKMKTKAFLSARGIPTAKLFARIDTRRQLKKFDFNSLPDECVLKPNAGFGGEGIIILRGRKNGEFLEQGKRPISKRELTEHIEDILDGKFSVNGQSDIAFFEKILVADDAFNPFRPAGLPDIRIIVFNLVPVMAMLRIPTAASGGKANVHLGGIGIGIDIAKGVTTHAAQYDAVLKELPHGMPVAGMRIPRWEELLLIASKIQYLTNIGYLAADLTLDRDLGPVLLEVNARAGLMVQVANLAPLRARLERVEGLNVSTPEKGVRLALELFGDKREQKRKEAMLDKVILGTRETIELAAGDIRMEESVHIAPEQKGTVFSPALITELTNHHGAEPVKEKEGTYKVKFTLGGRKIQTLVHSGETGKDVRAVIGGRDLSGFLIDPGKRMSAPAQVGIRRDLRAMDHLICGIDRSLPLLKYLRPVNLSDEMKRLAIDRSYNPVFLQRECDIDLNDAEQTLKRLETDESPLGILLRKKRRELLLKIDLIRSRGDALKFTAISQALYGTPSPALIGFAAAHLRSQTECEMPAKHSELMTAEEAKIEFEQCLQDYGLHDWEVRVKIAMVADCAVGERRVFIRDAAKFSKTHIAALLAHEIETHVLTSENGMAQPYEIFRRGMANYLDTQEGLAIYNQNRVLPAGHEKRYLHAKNVLAVAFAMEHSFAEVRAYLEGELGFRAEKALTKAVELKRGFANTSEPGALTRSLVYFRGLRAIEHFLSEGGDLKKLFIGKVAIEDLGLIEKIEGIRPPVVLPLFLREQKKSPKKAPKRGSDRT